MELSIDDTLLIAVRRNVRHLGYHSSQPGVTLTLGNGALGLKLGIYARAIMAHMNVHSAEIIAPLCPTRSPRIRAILAIGWK
jgi:hypothetical protein